MSLYKTITIVNFDPFVKLTFPVLLIGGRVYI